MGFGIQVCGLNGSGKSTLGRALAEELGFHFIDNEVLFFARRSDGEPYTNPRTREEVARLLMEEVTAHPEFVFAAVRGNYGQDVLPLYNCAVLLEAPKEIRMQRIRERSFRKFGDRMLPGGDLHQQEEAFFRVAESRPDDFVESWAKALTCPIIRADGTKPIRENVDLIVRSLRAGGFLYFK